MKDLFLKRKQEFRKECLGYLRYVLNDHFVLFLLVLLGFLAYQYNQLLQHFPENHFPILILIGMISILLLLWGDIATLGQCTDSLFAPVCAFILSHGSWFDGFWSLSPCRGDSKIRDFSSKI